METRAATEAGGADPVDGYDGETGHTVGNASLRTGWKAKLCALMVSIDLGLWERVNYLMGKHLETISFIAPDLVYIYIYA